MRRRPGWRCGAPAPIPRRPAPYASRPANGWRGSSPGLQRNCWRRCRESSWNWWLPSNTPTCPGERPILPFAISCLTRARSMCGSSRALPTLSMAARITQPVPRRRRSRPATGTATGSVLTIPAHMPTARWLAAKRDGRRPELRCSRAMLVMDGVRAGASLGVLACVAGDEDPALQRLTPPIPNCRASRSIWWSTGNCGACRKSARHRRRSWR